MRPKKRGMRFLFTLWLVHVIRFVMRRLRHRASHFPGEIALKLCPDFLGRVDHPAKIIAVTGTNGKTTVSHLLATILRGQGYSLIHNSAGSNTEAGIISSLLETTDWRGRSRTNLAVLEIDERSSIRIYKHIRPDYLLVTNLFRDSYMRNATPDFITYVLNSSIPDDTILVLNGDDLLSQQIKPENKRLVFAVEPLDFEDKTIGAQQSFVHDLPYCPKCSGELEELFNRYHHIGHYRCKDCGYTNPPATVAVKGIDAENEKILLQMAEKSITLPLLGTALSDIYNQVAVVTLLSDWGLSEAALAAGFGEVEVPKSRFDGTEVGDKTVIMILSKGENPVATSRVLDQIRRQEGSAAVIFVNIPVDELTPELKPKYPHTIEPLPWIYELDFAYLNVPAVTQVVVASKSYLDYKLSFSLAGVDLGKCKFIKDPRALFAELDIAAADTFYVLYDFDAPCLGRYVKQQLIALLQGSAV